MKELLSRTELSIDNKAGCCDHWGLWFLKWKEDLKIKIEANDLYFAVMHLTYNLRETSIFTLSILVLSLWQVKRLNPMLAH